MSGVISVSPLGRMPNATFAGEPAAGAAGSCEDGAHAADTITAAPMAVSARLVSTRTAYQFTFAPMRATRGGTMLVGRRNDAPEAHVMFCTGFALNTL